MASTCKYSSTGIIPSDKDFPTAVNTNALTTCNFKANDVDFISANIDTLDAIVGNITTLNSDVGNITTLNSDVGNITTVNGTTVNSTTGNITTVNSTNVVASTSVTSPVYQVAGLQVVSFRQAAIANAGAVGAVYVQAEVQEIVDQLNAILSALRAHGLIAV
jgi:hypothetical protein